MTRLRHGAECLKATAPRRIDPAAKAFGSFLVTPSPVRGLTEVVVVQRIRSVRAYDRTELAQKGPRIARRNVARQRDLVMWVRLTLSEAPFERLAVAAESDGAQMLPRGGTRPVRPSAAEVGLLRCPHMDQPIVVRGHVAPPSGSGVDAVPSLLTYGRIRPQPVEGMASAPAKQACARDLA